MERRRDSRHGLRCLFSLRCGTTRRVWDGLETQDVSASGLRFVAHRPHGLHAGDRIEVRLHAPVGRPLAWTEVLVLATDAVVLRAGECEAALRFERPLAW